MLSEGIPDVVYPRAPVVYANGDDIKPAWTVAAVLQRDVGKRQAAELVLLQRRYRHLGWSELGIRSGLHLTEHQNVSLLGDNVDLSVMKAVVRGQDPESVFLQVLLCQGLPVLPTLLHAFPACPRRCYGY